MLLFPFYFWWEPWRTRHWPTAKAKVIEVDRKFPLGLDGNELYIDSKPDLAIEYEVNGKRYVQKPNIESNVRVGGITVSKRPIVSEEFEVRYRPGNPDDYSHEHAIKSGPKWIITTAFWILGVVAIAGGLGVGNS